MTKTTAAATITKRSTTKTIIITIIIKVIAPSRMAAARSAAARIQHIGWCPSARTLLQPSHCYDNYRIAM